MQTEEHEPYLLAFVWRVLGLVCAAVEPPLEPGEEEEGDRQVSDDIIKPAGIS